MTIEKESTDADVYAPYNPYEMDNMSEAGSETALSTTDSVSSRRLGSLASKTKAIGRLDSVNNHHKTTLGGVQKMRFKPIVPTTRRVSKSNVSFKSDSTIKNELRRTDDPLQKAHTNSHIRRQDIITPKVAASGPFSQGPSFKRSVNGEANIGHITSRDTYHAFSSKNDSQTRSSAIYGDIQLPIDLTDTPETKIMYSKRHVFQEMETRDRMAAESDSKAVYDAKSSNDLGDLGNVNNGSLILIQMPSILPSFRPAGEQYNIPHPPSPVSEKNDNIVDISEPETVYLGQSKQKSKSTPKKTDKGKSKAKEESKKKGKENRRTSTSSKVVSAADDRSRRKMSVTSLAGLNAEQRESEKSIPRRRPEIDICHLPDGQIGSLLVYKSGKVKLRVGETIMDLESGILANCLEELVIVEPNDKPHACQLGSVQHKLVASPNLDDLFKAQD
ncbi:RNA polymerase III RPC4-domain-containing protein [Umbelopsis sp. AD052]|nr:RNA polymerase III RPC4-domain-containing protein [Umbelopsis sp. AD052]